MAIFGTRFKIVSRSRGAGSCVATAAYDARERLWDAHASRTRDYTHAHSYEQLVANLGIRGPESTPAEWLAEPAMAGDAAGLARCAEAATELWNAAEAAEAGASAQLARRAYLSLPRELSLERNIALAQSAIDVLVADGMVVSGVIHAGLTGDLHLHLQAPVRPFGSDGFCATKRSNAYVVRDGNSHEETMLPSELREANKHGKVWEKVYLYDLHDPNDGSVLSTAKLTPSEARQPIYQSYQRRNRDPVKVAIHATSWNDRSNASRWRAVWADLTNAALVEAGVTARVSPLSYAARGIAREAQVHEGEVVTRLERQAQAQAEAEGRPYEPVTDARRLNLEIRDRNEVADVIDELKAASDLLDAASAVPARVEQVADIVGDPAMGSAWVGRIARDTIAASRQIRVAEGDRGSRRDPILWARGVRRRLSEAGMERPRSTEATLAGLYARLARAAERVRRAAATGTAAVSVTLGAWGTAWADVRDRVAVITSSIVAHGGATETTARRVASAVRRLVTGWADDHRAAIHDDDRSTATSSSSVAASDSPAPTPSHDLVR